ncbi:MAG: phenylalanine--tRNA ligase subunit alpha [Candidatus Nezhaarchaeota archaeon]|nr:phenylalanine--tRNA ligase subunit alpha [Candidatus Nezhaarchaeota archaeon]
MNEDIELKVSEGELKVLRYLKEVGGPIDALEVAEKLGLSLSSVMSYVEALSQKSLVKVEVKEEEYAELTSEGEEYARSGLPERRVINRVMELGGTAPLKTLMELTGLKGEEVSLALGWISRKKLGEVVLVNGERRIRAHEITHEDPVEVVLRDIKQHQRRSVKNIPGEVLAELKSRRLITLVKYKKKVVSLTDRGLKALEDALQVKVVGALTSDLIKSGDWKKVHLKPYDVAAKPPTIYPARKHFYAEFLDKVRGILVQMGFIEADGPYVELEFWNFDALFQAQDHPAREIHDCFILLEPSSGVLPERRLVERVKSVHEEKWGYSWSESQASRLVLRSHTTAVSARFLAGKPKPPVKMFCMSKVFRPDVIDATHFIEFTQVDGIYGGEHVNLRVLLGVLREFAKRLGFKEVRFRPSYFPFTEPSVEGSVYHPELGWIECLGAGMLRPEVLEPLEIGYPVAAWGIGIDRLAMVMLGISDIRSLCTRDLKYLRSKMVMPLCPP